LFGERRGKERKKESKRWKELIYQNYSIFIHILRGRISKNLFFFIPDDLIAIPF
jgi:hypothetical protein